MTQAQIEELVRLNAKLLFSDPANVSVGQLRGLAYLALEALKDREQEGGQDVHPGN